MVHQHTRLNGYVYNSVIAHKIFIRSIQRYKTYQGIRFNFLWLHLTGDITETTGSVMNS